MGLADCSQAWAGCSETNSTITQCDAGGVIVTPNTGSSSLTVDGVTTQGVYYTPGDSATGSYTQTLVLSGTTTIDNPSSTSGLSAGNGVTLKTALANQNVNVTVGSSVSITAFAAYGGGIWARSETSGDITIDSSGTVTVTGVDGSNNPVAGNADGITASTSLGGASVTNRGTVTTNGRGLYAEGNHNSVTLDADLNVTGVLAPAKTVIINNSGTVNAYLAGARAINYNGLSSIINSGAVTSATRQALIAWSDYGDASVTNNGTVSSGDRNAIVAQTGANGNATVINSGTVSASRAASTGSAAIGYSGIRAYATSNGNVTIVNSGTVTANNDAALVGHTPQGSINITNSGVLTGQSGIFADSGSGTGSVDTISDTSAASATTSGAITVVNTGTINTTSHGIYLDGTTNGIANSGTVSSSGGTALVTGSGASTIANSGTINGQGGAITGAVATLNNSGLIAGSITNTGTSTMTITGGDGAYAVLTGYNGGGASLSNPGTVGTLTSGSADITLSSGKIWLNDNVNLSGRTLTVGGNASLKISNTLVINGNYVQNGGNLLITDGGVLTLSGTNRATVSNTTVTFYGTNLTTGTYTLVDANVSGTYSDNSLKIRGTSGLSGVLSTADNGNDLVITLSPSNYTGKGQSAGGSATGMGVALDAISHASSPVSVAFQNTVLAPLSDLSPVAQQTAIKQLTPSQVTPAAQAAQATAPTTSVIEQHELALLENNGGGIAAGSDSHSYGLWGQVIGGGALRSTSGQVNGYRSRSFGLVSGLDHMMPDGGVIGIAASWTKGWNWGADGASGTYATMNSYQVTGYGLHRLERAFADWQLGFGYNTFDQTRAIQFLGQRAKADYDGQQYLVKLGGGYDFDVNGEVTLTPLAGLRFLRAVSAGYRETGSDANLAIDRRGVQSLTHDLGGKLSWKLLGDWGQVTPEVRLAWVHDYTQGPIASSGLIGGQIFTSTVARTSPDGAKINLAATIDTYGDINFRAEYEGEFRPAYQSHTGLVKATWTF
ncbi:autotransporter outer membrane beta-barrel domain-containing protein [Telmatospirillum siberiense]|uniref:autotransporter outer membrane beta-barrel domain-containing protein n=1 Tax=Telmatospirillum siberiense TaxID=382514 RepID=UPI0013046EE6|nr:autotransporter outer membrane beta-barrel domain-containing protein [Telmatospirillum siberiense]